MGDVLYKKVGRKYVPQNRIFDFEHAMPVGSFMLVYASKDGSKQFEYEVKPDTASFVAAAMVAKGALIKVIRDKSEYKPDGTTHRMTKKQIAILNEYRAKMLEAGGSMPTWWKASSDYDLADAAIKAVREYAP
jgi:hypothetical protein